MTTEVTGLKIKLTYEDNMGSCTISNLVKTANDLELVKVAKSFELIQKYLTEKLVKTVETKLTK